MEGIDINDLLSAFVGAAVGGLLGVFGTLIASRESKTKKEIDRLRLIELQAKVGELERERRLYKPSFNHRIPDNPILSVNIGKYDQRSAKISYKIVDLPEEDSLKPAEKEYINQILNIDT